MKNILLLNDLMADNSSLPAFFTRERVSPPNYDEDLDTAITNYLITMNNSEINSITLPISLSNNFLELSGLRVGHHIRLTKELNFRTTPLIFYGSLSVETIAKISPLASILFTPNVHYVNVSEFTFDSIVESIKNIGQSNSFDFNKYLEFVRIEPPVNYQSHHSIDNELALLRWSEYLRCADQIPEVQQNIKTGLYFKYKDIQSPVAPVETNEIHSLQENAKVLLIDDESEKGWKTFYKCLFGSNSSIELDTLEIDYKSNNQNLIIEETFKKVETFEPDIILLDLRLCDIDFEEDTIIDNLTGVQILKQIKELNRGIQVIITTASNKVWNFEVTQKYGANGYIIKSGASNVEEDINNLKGVVILP